MNNHRLKVSCSAQIGGNGQFISCNSAEEKVSTDMTANKTRIKTKSHINMGILNTGLQLKHTTLLLNHIYTANTGKKGFSQLLIRQNPPLSIGYVTAQSSFLFPSKWFKTVF